jgi:hypothetical protein
VKLALLRSTSKKSKIFYPHEELNSGDFEKKIAARNNNRYDKTDEKRFQSHPLLTPIYS